MASMKWDFCKECNRKYYGQKSSSFCSKKCGVLGRKESEFKHASQREKERIERINGNWLKRKSEKDKISQHVYNKKTTFFTKKFKSCTG